MDFVPKKVLDICFILKKKYAIRDNPKIINYIHVANVNWAIVNTEIINKNSKKLILLNYPGSKFKVNLRKIENNLFELKKTFFLYDKFNNIESLEVINKSNNFNKINWKLEGITVDAS